VTGQSQLGLVIEKGAVAQILTIMLDQIKCLQDRAMPSRSAAQLIEV
jgi:hypothetical protein